MKQYVRDLYRYERRQGESVFFGHGGEIGITVLEGVCVKVAYRFPGAEVRDALVEATAQIAPERGLTAAPCAVTEAEENYLLEASGGVRVQVEKRHGLVSVFYGGALIHGGAFQNPDLVVPSYPVRLLRDGGHLLARFNFPIDPEDEFYGLGDKTGAPNRRGQRFRMFNRDSLGYDASNSDPLYKSVPFYLKINRKTGALCGVLFPEAMLRTMDFGRESPYYSMVEVENGPFEYRVFWGESYREIVGAYCRLTGMPALPPLFSFGFLASSMNYVEPQDAAARVLRYFERVEKERIPCEGMYFSSGYLKAPNGKRYALLWNEEKFPRHGEYLHALRERGYNLIMNIKPGVLTSHPWYEELKEKGYFIKGKDGSPYVEYFWGGDASFIDFTNAQAKHWWKEQLKAQYIVHGCMGIWNDNNELELEDTELESYQTRALYPVLMCQAAYEAFKELQPDKRPWVYSRAGYAGLQRYARTWTGDNTSTFATLHYNQYMGLSLGLCGMPYYGHDLGGFFGETPEEELMLRSCETAVFQPRFVIHSWRESGNPTEPWSYPSGFERIRMLIYAHYAYMPYLYNCAIEASLMGVPIERMLRLEFPADPNLRGDEVDMLCGPYVLKVSVTEKGVTQRQLYLPAGERWYDPRRRALLAGGQTVSLDVPMDGQPHILLRMGGVVPSTEAVGQLRTGYFEQLTFLLLPREDGLSTQTDYFEDDGVTELDLHAYGQYSFLLEPDRITVTKTRQGRGAPPPEARRMFKLRLPAGFAFCDGGEETVAFAPDRMRIDERLTWSFAGTYRRA